MKKPHEERLVIILGIAAQVVPVARRVRRWIPRALIATVVANSVMEVGEMRRVMANVVVL